MSGVHAQGRVGPQAGAPRNQELGQQRTAPQDRLGNAELQARMNQQQGADMMLAQVQGTRRPQARQPVETAEQRQRREFGAAYDRQLDQPVAADQSYWQQMSADEWEAFDRARQEGTQQNPAAGQEGHVETVGTSHYRYGRPSADALPNRRALVGNNANFYAHAFAGSRTEQVTTKDKRGRATTTERQRPTLTTLNADGTSASHDANDSGMVELPTSGYGFATHNRNDVQLNGRQMPDQMGSPDSVARSMNVAADYRTMFPGSQVSFGDLSDDKGGSPLLYSGNPNRRHGSHYGGSQADLQYPSGTGSTNGAASQGDNLFRTNALTRLAENRGMNNFYMATNLEGRMVMSPDSAVGYNSGHDDHLHMGRGNGHGG